MFEIIKKFFSKGETDKGTTSADLFGTKPTDKTRQRQKCLEEHGECILCNEDNDYLQEVYESPNLDPNKETILILDDNAGVISFLIDDFNSIKERKNGFDFEQYNILKLDTKLAAFKLRALLYGNDKIRIKYAILDITLGGTLFDKEGMNITLDGVDSLLDIIQFNKDVRYFFYTGNKLNPYIKKNEEIIKKYREQLGKDIDENILFKTSLSRDERQAYINSFFREQM